MPFRGASVAWVSVLVIEKIQTMMFTRRRGAVESPYYPEAKLVPLTSSLRYLEMLFKNKGTMFDLHLYATADRAQRIMGTLCRLIPNVGGPSENKRHLLASIM